MSKVKYSIRSPLRYPGSKRRLGQYVRSVIKTNNLYPSLYIEPFVGGGSVALQLLQYNLVEKVILMDIDPWVSSFWKTVFFDTDWLIEKILTAPISLELWDDLKKSNPRTIRERAWTGFYLNRTSFSGILERRVGPLGGREQKSNYKIDCRFPRETLVKRVTQISQFRDKIHAVWNCSWDDGISRIKAEQKDKKLPKNNLFYYLDPPFFEKAESLYRYYFEKQDHVKLRNRLLRLKDNWLLSYDSAKQVEILYGDAIHKKTNGTNHHHVDIYYSLSILSERRIAKEVIISNLPNLPS